MTSVLATFKILYSVILVIWSLALIRGFTFSRETKLSNEVNAEHDRLEDILGKSVATNSALNSQLESLNPQISSLEHDLIEAESKLEAEFNLRRQSELAQDEAEARALEMEGSLEALKQLVEKGTHKMERKVNSLKTDYNNSAWCPSAYNDEPNSQSRMCQSNSNDLIGCAPCQRKFLILVATGRSASTTLTWMLDTLPGVRMSGENFDLMGKLFSLHNGVTKDLIERSRVEKMRSIGSKNKISTDSVKCTVQKFVETINPPQPPQIYSSKNATDSELKKLQWIEDESNKIVGFKTIEFMRNPEFAKYLQEMLPCTRFVINIRSDTTAQTSSQNAKFNYNFTKTVEWMENENSFYRNLATDVLGPNKAFLLDSSQWTKDVTKLNEVVDWLGFTPECHFEGLLEFNTMDTGYGHGKSEFKRPLDTRCRYIGA